MIGSKKVVCVIPARLQSLRFPRKILSSIQGKPLLQWVWEAAHTVPFFDRIIFAIDAEETASLIKSFGGKYEMTSLACKSGTERLVELQKRKVIDSDIWVCWQGDEPFIKRPMIEDLLQTALTDGGDVWTLKKQIYKREEIESPHIAKVVCDEKGRALYFSRSVIPYYRDPTPEERKLYFKHIGIYAYSKEALAKIATLPSFYLEEAEQLEQLRFLAGGLRVQVHETQHEVVGIDLPEHLAKAEAFLQNKKST